MMKKFLLIMVLMLMSIASVLRAQTVPATGAGAYDCYTGCSQIGWIGSGNYWISNAFKGGGEYAWLPTGVVPSPPSNPIGSDGGKHFLSLYASGSVENSLSSQMTGLIVGRSYTLKYYVMSSKADIDDAYGDPTGFATKAAVSTNNVVNTHTFTEGVNTNQWILGNLKFTAIASSQTLLIVNGTKTYSGGFINVDIAGAWLTMDPCDAGTAQVQVNSTLTNTCPSATANLNNAFTGWYPPSGNNVLVWFKDPAHSLNQIVNNPSAVGPGTYYAFFHDLNNDCYNTSDSKAKVVVSINACQSCKAGTSQVSVKASLKNICPSSTVNLNDALVGSAPAGTFIVWYVKPNPQPQDPWVTDPAHIAKSGDYYAFIYDQAANCKNVTTSTAKVSVGINNDICHPGVKSDNASLPCQGGTVNLPLLFSGLIPSGAELRWFDNSTHSGEPISTPTNVQQPGEFYTFYYYGVTGTYDSDNSAAKITVTRETCPDLSPTIEIDNLNFNEGAARDFTVNIYEINGAPSSGAVSFRITKSGSYTISYPTVSGTSDVDGGQKNDNSNWTFTENAGFITATSSLPISANGAAVIGFNIKRKAGQPKGVTQNITSTIVSNSGGETNSGNNQAIRSVSTN
ncbi:hypothetical protein [Dyadobacter luticola]|uniref:DUF642 domain-containing protein n=1 Tax=Dyadobacter luticola TaxID=1979387 RepID=A0A5R9L126_9BACT|nr:hypothetical protein [Dyadobacter luticola]TLV02121.1 hypothetical protein FEN17_00290 [Dyadobacter luticola]